MLNQVQHDVGGDDTDDSDVGSDCGDCGTRDACYGSDVSDDTARR